MPEEKYHRIISTHNRDELPKVRESMEVWGREAKVLAHGLCVKAYPGARVAKDAYTFETPVVPLLKGGFRDNRFVVREIHWPEGHAGVEYRQNGEFVCVRITSLEAMSGDDL